MVWSKSIDSTIFKVRDAKGHKVALPFKYSEEDFSNEIALTP